MDEIVVSKTTPTDNLYLALAQCFAIILCGYVAGRLGIIRRSEANGLNTFVGTFTLPSLIFLSLAKLDFGLVNWRFLLAVTLAKSCVFFIVLVISMLVSKPWNPGRSALFAIFATQSNDFAIGYPMIDALYHNTHPEYSAYLYLMAPISLAILNPIGFVLLEIAKRRNQEQSNWSLFIATVKGIALNPVLAMTVLGIIGNLIFSHSIPAILSAILEVFGNAFSASALFLLGLMMVGKIHTLRGIALLIPGILISVKLLVLPLVIRESVILLNAGINCTDTNDLSTYGFLYGTIPTAPALFVFTLRYNVDIDLIASAMVACTFLSAPLMFISAKMIDAVSSGISPQDYAKQLNAFSLDTSAAATAACIWLLICFLALGGQKYKRLTHRCTLCIIIAQLASAVGVIIWTKIDTSNAGDLLWYVQFVLIVVGVYASRFWTAVLAATILFLSSRTEDVVKNVQKWCFPIAWGGPLLIVSIMCLFASPEKSLEIDRRNPNFQLGSTQAATSMLVLIFCFVVTLGCLILQQRYQRRTSIVGYSTLPDAPLIPEPTNTNRNVRDVEDLVSSTALPCEFDCSNGSCTANEEQPPHHQNSEYDASANRSESDDLQILRHQVLLILLLCSMFIGLVLSIGTLLLEQMTGIYAELAFLDVALNFGQSLIAFAIFGLDPGLGALGCWLRKVCRTWCAAKEIELPEEVDLSPEAKMIREQFARCHLVECRARISMCRRRLLQVYEGVFTGKSLVDWLIEANVAHDREEAVRYGRCLLDSRVLRHVDGTEHFQDRDILYTFRT
ncbi:integral membrane protein GPR155 [Cephus cinctus]|uniref:Integral membrane protein GPR155 n=1 Tax=Cephus cinctus TaxID=211228 RepID=A0AAJ7RPD9_CEPCN|nr:integral membrane protein GPR155 [Cephus cinctus]